jgi:tRNA-dihydrouridine synthase 4
MEDNVVLAMLQEKRMVRISAPMVRYSKLAFRMLVRNHGVDVAYTPMIISDCFVRSQAARDVEFTTNEKDRPLVVQFAAHNAEDFAAATEYVSPYADGVDLNCGCPQRWAMSEGYGSHLLKHPERIADMVATARRRTTIPVSVKIRIATDIPMTVELARRAERAGAAWITVHGRTPQQRCQPVDYDAIKAVKDALAIPVVANGDIMTLVDAEAVYARTGVNGVMSARGLLSNPALFDVNASVRGIAAEWVELALSSGTPFPCFHHHLMYMLEGVMSRSGSSLSVHDWLIYHLLFPMYIFVFLCFN